jgi:hypothetical protein
MIVPKKYYINKMRYLLKHYDTIFKNYKSVCNFDEDIIYYTIYPDWGKNLDSKYISDNYARKNYIDIEKNIIYPIEIYAVKKPFRYSMDKCETERSLYSLNHSCYYPWDIATIDLLKTFPDMFKYFKFIKTHRYTYF